MKKIQPKKDFHFHSIQNMLWMEANPTYEVLLMHKCIRKTISYVTRTLRVLDSKTEMPAIAKFCYRKAKEKTLTWEFDPGSGWTLAACLTHASRTKMLRRIPSGWRLCILSGGRVSNAWVTCPVQGDNSWKRLLIPHKRTVPHGTVWKTPVVQDGPASD